ncbi:MAG: 3-dehydroquinate synthase, partial [Betaproteobacteria bacterium]|nr:3-dehydroquinate synthase [Betaproteobacteria bacterium]
GRGKAEPLDRPLLATADPLPRIRELKAGRQRLYALCDWAVHTDAMTPEEAAAQVIEAWRTLAGTALAEPGRLDAMTAPEAEAPAMTLHAIPEGAACMVQTQSRAYPVFAGWGTLRDLGARLREAGLARQAYLISDERVFHHLGDEAEEALRREEIAFDCYTVPPGEASKTVATASGIYDWLIERKAERGHVVIALGGGVVTDLAGYVAATFARGLPLVHVPTSLLAMVDAAIGGKVGVNHPRAKNMIGAFYQPRLVLADTAVLESLPPRELSAGLAEVIKHGLVRDEGFVAWLEQNVEKLLACEPEALAHAVRRCCEIKAAVVAEDERETGVRALLNFGHTFGHAIESGLGYGKWLHGEAVAAGMVMAADLSRRMGYIAQADVDRVVALFARARLPTAPPDVAPARLMELMALDKKAEAGQLRFILLDSIGAASIRAEVPADLLQRALESSAALSRVSPKAQTF